MSLLVHTDHTLYSKCDQRVTRFFRYILNVMRTWQSDKRVLLLASNVKLTTCYLAAGDETRISSEYMNFADVLEVV